MTTRGMIRELLVAYMNSKRLSFVSISEFKKEYKDRVPKIDLYRIVYGLGLNDPRFEIVKDEETTYIRMV